MNQTGALHPPQKTLVAFVNGELDDKTQSRIEAHIQYCETCVEFLRTVPDDDLLKRIRSADTSSAGGATRMMPADATAISREAGLWDSSSEILAELQNHSRYKIVKPLGEGGMGVVYLAEHRVMERTVALKVITSRLISHPGAVERFHQEVKAAARLSHKNIVTAFDAEQIGSLHFLVMEYVDGVSLHTLVARQGMLPVKRACYYVMQAAMGLDHAHKSGMVHRDIKPQNLMLTPQGVVKILDFGLARLAAQEGGEDEKTGLTAVGMAVGTPDYMAPEQARDSRSVDARADIYSLGATFYFLLTGQTLFPEGTALEKVVAHLERTPRPVSELRPDVPPEVVAILERMLQKKPAKRYQTPAEVADELKQFLRRPPDASTPPEEEYDMPLVSMMPKAITKSRRRAKRRKRPRLIWPVILGVLFCVGLLWIAFQGPDENEVSTQTPNKAAAVETQGSVDANRAARSASAQNNSAVSGTASNKSASFAAQNAGTSQEAQFPSTFPANQGQWIDLLPMVDLQQVVAGQWSKSNGELHVEASPNAMLVLPYRPQGEYDFEIAFTRRFGTLSIAMFFVAGSGQATFEVDAWGKKLAGIQNVNYRDLKQRPEDATHVEIINGQRHVMLLKVRNTGTEGYLDGEKVARYQGDGSDLSLVKLWNLQAPTSLGLGAYQVATTFHQIRVRPVSGNMGATQTFSNPQTPTPTASPETPRQSPAERPSNEPDDIASLSDEFNDPATTKNWLRIHQTEQSVADQLERFDIGKFKPGWMTMVPYASTWYQDYRGVLVYKDIAGDFVATTRVRSTNRAGNGPPQSGFSLAGIMVRTPRTVTPKTWRPGGENYIFLSLGAAKDPGRFAFEVKTTIDSRSNLEITPTQGPEALIRVARLGSEFVLLRKEFDRPWVVQQRYHRPDMPERLQVGFTVYTDYAFASRLSPPEQNTQILRGGHPDLIASFDYMHYARPKIPGELQGRQISNPQSISDADLLRFLGD